MTYGLECWDGSGNKTLDVDSTYSRLVYSTTANANSDGSVDLPEIEGRDTAFFAYAQNGGDVLPHKVSQSGTIINWTAQSTDDFDSSASLILVFIRS